MRGLGAANGHPLDRTLREAILDAVIRRQSEDGGWHHGEWTDDDEPHSRLHARGLHRLMDELETAPSDAMREALNEGVAFLAERTDTLDSGTWFLHDSLELSVESMPKRPFEWASSRAFGKSESNMLVLDTHLDTLVAFDRYRALTTEREYDTLIESARTSLCTVLEARPAEWPYRLLFGALGPSLLPTPLGRELPALQRAFMSIGWKSIAPNWHGVKRRFPRLVMPRGHVQRALTLRGIGTAHQAINTMDLVRHMRRFPADRDLIMPVLESAFDLVVAGDLRRRREEEPKARCALEFWAETSYHLCSFDRTDARCREWLADAMLRCEACELGQAPSLLGANAEAVPVADQIPMSIPADARLRVANLCTEDVAELIVVNPAAEPLPLAWGKPPPALLEWRLDGAIAGEEPVIPAGGWTWGRATAA